MIKEAQYDKFLSPKTLKLLKSKSEESRKQMLGNMNIFQTMVMTPQLLQLVSLAEKNYIPQLENLAVNIVKEVYPVINDLDITIDAKIVGMDEITGGLPNKNEDEPDIPSIETPENIKRRLINGITQGGSVRGGFIFNLFREHLDELNENLFDNYNKVLKITLGIYDDEQAIAMLLAMLAQQKKAAGGSAEVEHGEDEDGNYKLKIKARALNFPMLVYEIIKGLYELVSLQGFGPNLSKNQQTVQQVDTLENEPDDLRYGKFIYDAIQGLFANSEYWEDTRVREYFLGELYKMSDEYFIEFIENLLNNQLDSDQKWWINKTFAKVASEIKRRDSPSSLFNDDNDDEGEEQEMY
jgi:hypothetical protein